VQQPVRTGRNTQARGQIDGCQEITLKGEGRSPNHRGRLPGLAHSGKTGGDRRGRAFVHRHIPKGTQSS
jgi:hypothetical protein